MRRIELVDDQTLGITFPYNEEMIGELKKLTNRRWNAQGRRWEVHISHLKDIVRILHVDERNLPRQILKVYEEEWINTATRLRIGNAMTRISGTNIPFEEIDQATSFWVEGADHSTKYKKGEWDGQRHLFRMQGDYQCPTGLLEPVLRILRNTNTEFEATDERKVPTDLQVMVPRVELRDYQKEALARAVEKGHGVLQMATGSGKTVVAGHIMAVLGCRALFFVHTKDLLYQAIQQLREILGIPVGQIGDGVAEPDWVTVATVQTVSRALDRVLPREERSAPRVQPAAGEEDEEAEVPEDRLLSIVNTVREAGAVFFDECHHLPAETCFSIALECHNAYYRFGLSATPYRSDRMDLLIEAAVGPRIVKIDSSCLIENGFLVSPHITLVRIPAQPEEPRETYHRIYQREIVRNKDRNEKIVSLAREFLAQRKTVLVLVNQVRHGTSLAKMMEEGVLLTGQDSSEFRNRTLEGLRDRSIPLVIATTLADEGLDIPSLDVLILAGAGKSETKALQRIGRALRKVDGKEKAYVVDFLDGARFLKDHSLRRLEIYRTESRFEIEVISGEEAPVEPAPVRTNGRKPAAGRRKSGELAVSK